MNLAIATADFAAAYAPFLECASNLLGSLLMDSLFPASRTNLSAWPAVIMFALESIINIVVSPTLSSMPWQSFLAFSKDLTAIVGSPLPNKANAILCNAYACPFLYPAEEQMLSPDSAAL